VRALRGSGRDGQFVEVDPATPGRWTLLLFLSEHCEGCGPFWEAAGDPEGHGLDHLDLVVLVRRVVDRDALDVLADGIEVPVLIAPSAYDEYRVAGAPFYVAVDGGQPMVATEGVAWSVPQVLADVARARSD
jgi:hypothetical protein